MGIMEKKNGNYNNILGSYWDDGKENGNYYHILWLCWDIGKENGNYYFGFAVTVHALRLGGRGWVQSLDVGLNLWGNLGDKLHEDYNGVL